MSRKRKPLPILTDILITDVAAEGKAIAKVDNLVIFVPYVVPGDVVDLQIKRKKHSYAEAEAIAIKKYSELRAQPFCKHFGVCGGCKWQCLPYEELLQVRLFALYKLSPLKNKHFRHCSCRPLLPNLFR